MLIAAKLEDKTLSASYLSDTTLNKYTSDEITNMEWDILIRLGFKVNMPTLNSWANRLSPSDITHGVPKSRVLAIRDKIIDFVSFLHIASRFFFIFLSSSKHLMAATDVWKNGETLGSDQSMKK